MLVGGHTLSLVDSSFRSIIELRRSFLNASYVTIKAFDKVGTKYHLSLRCSCLMSFKKYFRWAPEHAAKISSNFNARARNRLKGLFCDARRKHKKPKFVPPPVCKSLFITGTVILLLRKKVSLGRRPGRLLRVTPYTLLELLVRLS